MKYDFLIVGAGLYGCVMAERLKSCGKSVLMIEKRNHIGGNCYSEEIEGITVHKYGPHIFHTDNQEVLNYITQFGQFDWFEHKAHAIYRGEEYSFPINLKTINKFYNVKLNSNEVEDFLKDKILSTGDKSFLSEYAISLYGRELYEAFIEGYTIKQWNKFPEDLTADIIKRLPHGWDKDSYYDDKYQGVPVKGYTKLFEKMLDGIYVYTGAEFKKNSVWEDYSDKIIYTGPIDKYFEYRNGELNWRSLYFEYTTQISNSTNIIEVFNFPEKGVPYTRLVCYHNKLDSQCIEAKEFPCNNNSEPYYPVNLGKDKYIFEQYKKLAAQENNVHFGGRLAEYKYYDMDEVIAKALKDYKQFI
jgi:UDP-galactopyranose mutase